MECFLKTFFLLSYSWSKAIQNWCKIWPKWSTRHRFYRYYSRTRCFSCTQWNNWIFFELCSTKVLTHHTHLIIHIFFMLGIENWNRTCLTDICLWLDFSYETDWSLYWTKGKLSLHYLSIGKTITGFQSTFLYKNVYQNKIKSLNLSKIFWHILTHPHYTNSQNSIISFG